MTNKIDKTLCRNPDPAKQGTNIPTWKYEALSSSIVKAIKAADEQTIALQDLFEDAGNYLTQDEKSRMGSIGWHTMSVKFEMEVRGELVRKKVGGRQHLSLAESASNNIIESLLIVPARTTLSVAVAADYVRDTYPGDLKLAFGSYLCPDRGPVTRRPPVHQVHEVTLDPRICGAAFYIL